jgi:predicted phage terminase large subunit-like protein
LEGLLADPEATARALDCADARESLHAFCGLVELPGVALVAEPDDDDDTGAVGDLPFAPIETPQAAHHVALLDLCERIERGEVRRAMVFMPPGSAKSTYASVAFPAWFMGRKKGRNVGVATYATGLARKVGRRIRSIVRQKVYRDIFDTGLSRDQGAVNEWALENGSEFMGEGILAGWTGNRLDGLVIDDPVKNREEADSPVIQAKVRSEYDDSLKSRLKPGGWVLIIQTRWNERDLPGQLLPEDWDGESGPILCRDGLVWEVLCIPAEAGEDDPLGRRPGEMLWLEWFGRDPDFWTAARRIPRTWSALYQQRPSAKEGTYFIRAWFDGGEHDGRTFERRRYRVGAQPANLKKYITSDHAPTDGEDSDPNVGRVWGLDSRGDLWLLDGFNAVQKMDKTAEGIIGLIKAHRPFAWFPEADNNYKAAEPFIIKEMKAAGVRTRIEPISPHGNDKATKAQSFQGMCAMQQVWIPEGPMGDAVIEEYVKFPAGAHDEEVDCGSLMGRAIAMAHPALVTEEKKDAGSLRGINEMTFDELMARQQPKEEWI